ncbi:MAG: hypothetical protein ACRDIY_08720 [Chloroflexota bacterium]
MKDLSVPDAQGFVDYLASIHTVVLPNVSIDISSKPVLIDGERLAQLMIDCDIGVSTFNVYEVKVIDQGYFLDE